MIGMSFISKSLFNFVIASRRMSITTLSSNLSLNSHSIPDIRMIVNNNRNLQITNNDESNRSGIILIYLQEDYLLDSSSHQSISQSITHSHSRLFRILGCSESNFLFFMIMKYRVVSCDNEQSNSINLISGCYSSICFNQCF